LVSTGTTRFSTAIAINELVRMIQGRWHVVSLTYVVLIGFWTVAAPPVAMLSCAPVQPRGIWMCSAEVGVDATKKPTRC
jgi:hypothetical protein